MTEKSEKPTPRRLQQAKKDGDVARSKLCQAAFSTAGVCGGIAVAHSWFITEAHIWIRACFLGSTRDLSPTLHQGALLAAKLMGCVGIGASAGAFVGAACIGGLHWSPGLLFPAERLGGDKPGPLARLFSRHRLGELGRGASLVVAMLGFGVLASRDLVTSVVTSSSRSAGTWNAWLYPLATSAVASVLVTLGFLGLAEGLWARRAWNQKLRMSRDEVRREHKDAEGDPTYRHQRKSAHRALLQSGPQRGIASGSVVLVNPTHLAVVLRYAKSECDAPYVVAKATGQEAQMLRIEARRLGIPIVKDIPLARSLIRLDVGEEIPEQLYRAAAAVLAGLTQGSPLEKV